MLFGSTGTSFRIHTEKRDREEEANKKTSDKDKKTAKHIRLPTSMCKKALQARTATLFLLPTTVNITGK
jgi:hypothetical protein